MTNKKKIVRITTVPFSLEKLIGDQLGFMQQYYDVIAISSEGEELHRVAKKQGVRILSVQLTRKITLFKDLAALWNLYRILKKEKPFIVHSHTPKAGTVGMLAAKLANVPNRLHTVAGLPLMEKKGILRAILNVVEKLTYAAATKVYPNSKGLAEVIVEAKFCSSAKIKVIAQGSSNGINTNHFNNDLYNDQVNSKLRKELNIKPDDFVFLFIGRLVADKGMNELVHAFEILDSEVKNVKLLLVGDYEHDLDPLAEDTLNVIKENINIIPVGFHNDVRPYIAISDVLTFPSYREGFPNVVMQAGAMGLPSIVSNINGCNEIIIENENGTIIPVKDTHAIYKAMLVFVEDEILIARLKANARKMIVKRYEQKVVWEAILSEYKELENV